MSDLLIVDWLPAKRYTMRTIPADEELPDKPGLCIFAERKTPHGWRAIYVEEDGSLKRLSDKLRRSAIQRGATHVSFLTLHDADRRKEIAAELSTQWLA